MIKYVPRDSYPEEYLSINNPDFWLYARGVFRAIVYYFLVIVIGACSRMVGKMGARLVEKLQALESEQEEDKRECKLLVEDRFGERDSVEPEEVADRRRRELEQRHPEGDTRTERGTGLGIEPDDLLTSQICYRLGEFRSFRNNDTGLSSKCNCLHLRQLLLRNGTNEHIYGCTLYILCLRPGLPKGEAYIPLTLDIVSCE